MNKKVSLKSLIESFSMEKGLSDHIIYDSVRLAILYAAKKKFKILNVDVILDNEGCFSVYAIFRVIENLNRNLSIKNSFTEIPLQKAIEYDINAHVGGKVQIEIKSLSFDRIDIQEAKNIIKSSFRSAEREYITNEFRSKIGNLIIGKVRKSTTNLLIVDIDDNVEGIIKKKNLINGDTFKVGDKIRSIFSKIIKTGSKVILQLDRSCDNMLKALLFHEVPEIKEGLIEIKDISRSPGIYSKVSVKSNNPKLDSVGTCVGTRGLRIKSISKELNGEKIDIIAWDENPEYYIRNIFKPINIYSFDFDQVYNSVTISIRKSDFLKLIGKNGHNIKLINKLIKLNLKIKTR